jgi:carbonic anhydrase
MQKLVHGIHHFQRNVLGERQELFDRLANGQQPLALFITCSDSRIDPTMLTQTEPGELFILRTAGNIVPAYGAVAGGEAASIEYAVSVLKVSDVIVCGHSLCGAISALLNPEQLENLPAVAALLRHAEATRRIILENYSHIEEPRARLMAAIEENVLVQIENLRTHPSVAAALSRGDLRLHGWVYKFQTGEVFAYHADQQQYLPLSDQPTEVLAGAASQWPAI